MGLGELWGKYMDWLVVFIGLSVLIVFTIGSLQQDPQFIYPLAVAISVAIIFNVLLALRPKYRQGLIRRLREFHAREQRRGGWLYHYGNLARVFFYINLGIGYVTWKSQLIHLPQFFIAWLFIQLILGMVSVARFLTVAEGWWRYLITTMLILSLAAIALLSFFILFIW